MTYPDYIREKAQWMRTERRMTLTEISERLSIGKTTVWYWIKDLPLAPPGKALQTPRRTEARQRASKANSERAAARRAEAYELGREEFPWLCLEPTFRDFVCMYIGEGTKRNRNTVALANSDPKVICLADEWIRRFAANEVKYSLQYHADQDPDYLTRNWAFILATDESLITCIRKSNSGQLAGRMWRSRLGVLSIRVGDTQLRSRLSGWMDSLFEEWGLSSRHHGV